MTKIRPPTLFRRATREIGQTNRMNPHCSPSTSHIGTLRLPPSSIESQLSITSPYVSLEVPAQRSRPLPPRLFIRIHFPCALPYRLQPRSDLIQIDLALLLQIVLAPLSSLFIPLNCSFDVASSCTTPGHVRPQRIEGGPTASFSLGDPAY